MAAEAGIQPSVYLEHQLSHDHPTKKKTPPLIERLRHKVSQSRSWKNSINNVRSYVTERRTQTDVPESPDMKSCLDTMQKAIKVLSLKERLDLIGRQLGLNVDIQDKRISLGTDAFHVDVRLNETGGVVDVKLASQDCPDLRDVLKKGDYDEFIEHLQGLQSIYQVTNDENLKSKAFLALQSLEKDLNQLAQFQSSISEVTNYIHKCPLGVMLPRLAGKPMKLIYFVSPYDLLDKKSLTAHPLTVEAITENVLGQSATVCIEAVGESRPPNKLQTMPLMNVGKTHDGKSLPSFSGWSTMNSMMLPASFVLVLPQSIALSTHVLQKITSLTNLEVHQDSEYKNLQSLILESFSKEKPDNPNTNKLFVSLPDQHHVYILNGMNGGSQDQQGVMVSRIPFTHPTHVPKILIHIRQQLLFNIIIGSCVRTGCDKEEKDGIIFEVNAVSLQQLTVVFEHPAYDSMITVDIDLSDITNLKCRVSCTNPDQFICSDEAVSRVFQRCMSVPIMLRWLISKGRSQLDKLKEAALAAERERQEKAMLLKEILQKQAKMQPAVLPTKGRPPPQPPHPPPLPPPPSYPYQLPSSPHLSKGQPGSNGQAHMMSPIMSDTRNLISGLEDIQGMDKPNPPHINNDRLLMSPEPERAFNPLLSTLLDVEKGGDNSGEVNDSPMLSRLLDDNTSVATSVIPMNCKPNPPQGTKRSRKRKSPAEFSGPSPKHRLSESDSLGGSMDTDFGHIIPEQNLSPAIGMGMSGLPSMPPSHGQVPHHPMLNHSTSTSHQPGNVIDLTEDNSEPSLKKLADSVEKQFIRMDVKTDQDISMLRSENDHNQGRIPTILQNSPSCSKNENASTSLEGYLKGSGEVGRAKDFDPIDAASAPTGCSYSKLSTLLLASTDVPTSVSGKPQQINSGFLSDKSGSSVKTSVHHAMMTEMRTQSSGVLQHSSSVELFNEKQMVPGIFEKFDRTRQQQQPVVKSEVTENESNMVPSGGGKVSLKLRVPVGPLKQQNNVKTESDLPFPKPDNSTMFEFKSDEDDDEPIMPRYVHTPSPTNCQLSSNKQKRSSESGLIVKAEKTKKKDKSSSNSTKRKRDKEESKREKKKKKNEHLIESVYRTVENDEKADFKLKIRVAKKPILEKNDKSDFSDISQHSYEITKKLPSNPNDCKEIPNKLVTKDSSAAIIDFLKEKDSSDNSPTGALGSGKSASGLKMAKANKAGSSNLVSSKTDPKLVTKATIRLKPVNIPNSGSTVNVSQSGAKGTGGAAQQGSAKLERRSSSSTLPVDKRTAALSSLVERRSSSGSLDRRNNPQSLSSTSSSSSSNSTPSATPVTTTATNIALSSILPNAPTVSKIASMPRIPRLSSSSNTSISRTSSLDPATGTASTPTGTKSNNSYTMGPGGRHNSSIPPGPGPGGGRLPLNSPSYNSRMAPPVSWSHRSSLPFNSNRPMGPAHRQSSPMGNSGMRQSGPGNIHRPLSSSSSSSSRVNNNNNSNNSNNNSSGSGNIQFSGNGSKTGQITPGSNKSSSGFTNNPALKTNNGSSNFNHNANISQKQSGAGSRVNTSGMNNLTKSGMMNATPGGKSTQNPNNVMPGQRFVGSNVHSASGAARPSSTKSPNTSGINRSPNSSRSPNISGSNRSPSLNSASKSPNISGSGKSPNLNSASRSPSVTSSWSPNVNNASRSPSITTSSRSSVSVSSSSSSGKSSNSIKNSPNMMKSALVNKNSVSSNVSKSQSPVMSSSPFQKHTSSGSNTQATSRPSILKNSTSKINDELSSIVSVNNSLQQTVVSISSSSSTTNAKMVMSSNNSVASLNKKQLGDSDISTSSPLFQQCNRSLSSTVTSTAQMGSVSQSQNPHIQNSLSESKTCSNSPGGSLKHNNGSKVPPALSIQLPTSTTEKFPSSSSTPSTPLSADAKNKVSSPAQRGHKNSISAIVDKLKLNAARSVESSVSPTLSDIHFGLNNLEAMDNSLAQRKCDAALDDVFVKYSNSTKFPDGLNDGMKFDFPSGGNKLNSSVNTTIKMNPERIQEWSKALKEGRNDFEPLLKSSSHKEMHEANFTKSKTTDNVILSGENISDDKTITRLNRERPKPLTISTSSLVSPTNSPRSSKSFSSSPFPLLQSPLASARVPSPLSTSAMSKSIVDSGLSSQCNDTVFKIPSIKSCADQEERSPELRNGLESSKGTKASGFGGEEMLHSLFLASESETKVGLSSDRKSTSSKFSPLSDVSSPDNDLVIDDASPKSLGRSDSSSSKNNSTAYISNSTLIPMASGAPKSDKQECSSGLTPISIPPNITNSPQTTRDIATPSPKTSRPPSSASTKSPLHSKTQSGASTPKGSESPFVEIDDELMDVALGWDS